MALSADALVRAHVPPGYERDMLARLVRIGERFAAQQRGRKPGVLRRYVEAIVDRLCERTFENLLVELEFAALLGDRYGSTPILRVDRAEEVVRYLERGVERECSFKRIRNIAKLRLSRVPLTRETDF
jgi:hypothetical protein